ncbi:MAG: radical SAM protein [Deltaproteobacteria bacterium]|jgi:oxygen-independent coproporphyrinogen-3 oxidase|nr:radical SAM protein [Deltaproteobacteria bacterium]
MESMKTLPSALLPRLGVDPLSEAFDAQSVGGAMGDRSPAPPEAGPASYSRLWERPPKRPLSAYANVPFCPSFCPFCGFFKVAHDPETEERYVTALLKEAAAEGALAERAGLEVDALFVGGGTPAVLAADTLERLVRGLAKALPLAEGAELTLEGRCSVLDGEKLEAVWRSGVTRLSLGVQSFDTAVRNRAGRMDPREAVESRVREALAGAGGAVAADLIYGLPGQTPEIFSDDLRTAAALGVSGVSAYLLKPLPWRPGTGGSWPPSPAPLKVLARYFGAADGILRGLGFERVSRSHWSRDPRDRSRYNELVMGGRDLIGLGAGAGGHVAGTAYSNTRDIALYVKSVADGGKPLSMAKPPRDGYQILDGASLAVVKGLVGNELLESPAWSGPEVRRLLSLWREAGLATAEAEGLKLTLAGVFWQSSLEAGIRAALSLGTGGAQPSGEAAGATHPS